ncbi:hypothetical protein M427DRAFT_52414 [Gonapodya prolifera JEL478]|uniref:Vacuolar ATPase assembly protein VMA22 n=1 Tax=Gonapodya prolifera (strain JEL478) TaxID=1344416 RepID=A0A139ATX6_GONPJ|nr:hypothetical protein M427DRAFT_52414 [Gonapodya prolifera JEL478]|eukprot:KXS20154.1 hypothetical protein M427DRAFT_52414 [Gonapodya prolifera JEL478]
MTHPTADDLLLQILDLLDTYMASREPLKASVAKGFFNIAEARKTMGSQINQHNYDLRMKASATVAIDANPPSPLATTTVSKHSLSLVRVSPPTSMSSLPTSTDSIPDPLTPAPAPAAEPETTLRRRKNPAAADADNDGDGDDLGSPPAQETKPYEHETPQTTPTKAKHTRPACDPLKWFGVLVPGALREAQGDFTRALSYVVALADVQLEMARLEGELHKFVERGVEKGAPEKGGEDEGEGDKKEVDAGTAGDENGTVQGDGTSTATETETETAVEKGTGELLETRADRAKQ